MDGWSRLNRNTKWRVFSRSAHCGVRDTSTVCVYVLLCHSSLRRIRPYLQQSVTEPRIWSAADVRFSSSLRGSEISCCALSRLVAWQRLILLCPVLWLPAAASCQTALGRKRSCSKRGEAGWFSQMELEEEEGLQGCTRSKELDVLRRSIWSMNNPRVRTRVQ